jgi:hypothetical protein
MIRDYNFATDKSTQAKQSPEFCRHCGSIALDMRTRGPHLGIYCARCSRWLGWVPQGRPVKNMPFGKHKGTAVKDLPADYLNFVLENVQLSKSLYRTLSEEFERRGSVTP